MRIAVNTRFLAVSELEGYAHFTKGLILNMHQFFPEDVYTFLYDRKPVSVIHERNIEHMHSGPHARHPLLWKWWYDVSMPRMAKRAKAEVIFSPDGFCSLTTSIPQVLAIHDLAFLHYPEGISGVQRGYYLRNTPRFIRKAKHIVTVSEHAKADILQHYPEAAGKISVVYNDADPRFQPLDWNAREQVKTTLTAGCEYFLYTGAIHPRKNLVNLLKGFSWFKQRQKSNMKLVLCGRQAWKNDQFRAQLASYKYRHDVILTGYLPQERLVEVMAAAYALVYPSHWEGFGLPVLEAMRSGVPVIVSNNSALPEIAGDAGLLVDPMDHEAWGKAMGLMYKDEDFRSACIAKGHVNAARFSWEQSARELRDVLAKVTL
jgi:glycosyltransferase involved in cell wall biosynthesis